MIESLRRISGFAGFELLYQKRGYLFWFLLLLPSFLTLPICILTVLQIDLRNLGYLGTKAYRLASVYGIASLTGENCWSGFAASLSILCPSVPVMLLSILAVPESWHRNIKHKMEEMLRVKPYSALEQTLGIFLILTAPACLGLFLSGSIGFFTELIAAAEAPIPWLYLFYFLSATVSIFIAVSLALAVSSCFQSAFIPLVLSMFFLVISEFLITCSYALSDLMGLTLLQTEFTQTLGFPAGIAPFIYRRLAQVFLIPLFLFITIQNKSSLLFRHKKDLIEDVASKFRSLLTLFKPGKPKLKKIKPKRPLRLSLFLLFLTLAILIFRELWLRQDAVAQLKNTEELERLSASHMIADYQHLHISRYDIRILVGPHTGKMQIQAEMTLKNQGNQNLKSIDLMLNPRYFIQKITDNSSNVALSFFRMHSLLKIKPESPLPPGDSTIIKLHYSDAWTGIIPAGAELNFKYENLNSFLGSLGKKIITRAQLFEFNYYEPDRGARYDAFTERGFLLLEDNWYPIPAYDFEDHKLSRHHPGFFQAAIHVPRCDIPYWTVGEKSELESHSDFITWKTTRPIREIYLVWGPFEETRFMLGALPVLMLHLPEHRDRLQRINDHLGPQYKPDEVLPGPPNLDAAMIIEWNGMLTYRKTPPITLSETSFRMNWDKSVYSGKKTDWAYDFIVRPILNTAWYHNVRITGPAQEILTRALIRYMNSLTSSLGFYFTYKRESEMTIWNSMILTEFDSQNPDMLGIYQKKCVQFHATMDYLIGRDRYIELIQAFWKKYLYQSAEIWDFIEYLKKQADDPVVHDAVAMFLTQAGSLSYAVKKCRAEKTLDGYITHITVKNEGDFKSPVPLTLESLSEKKTVNVALPQDQILQLELKTRSKPKTVTLDPKNRTMNFSHYFTANVELTD